MVHATVHLDATRVGWGGMITFMELANMVDATSACVLSSHLLNKAPGLARIMQALRCHKMKCMSGLVSPTDSFKKSFWQLWH